VDVGRGAEPTQVLAGDLEREVVAQLHAPDVLVEDGLDAVDEGLALLDVALTLQLGQELLLFFVAPPAVPAAAQRDVVGRIGREDQARREYVPQLGLLGAAVQGSPVNDWRSTAKPLPSVVCHQGVLYMSRILG
jgi:hypothetical protein